MHPSGSTEQEVAMDDVIFVGLGVITFALFGLYATALRRI
jgi:hypothetical protein